MKIQTPRLILRSARPDDLEGLHAVLSDRRATLWWSTPPHETPDQTRTWLDAMIANGPDHPDFVVELDGRVIGKAGIYIMPDVGYILHPDCWGKGLAAEAVRAAVDHVFRTQDVDTLTADVDPDNAASIRLLDRLGFVRSGSGERTWNVGGVWKDSFYYALSRSDWAATAGGQAPA